MYIIHDVITDEYLSEIEYKDYELLDSEWEGYFEEKIAGVLWHSCKTFSSLEEAKKVQAILEIAFIEQGEDVNFELIKLSNPREYSYHYYDYEIVK